MADYNQPCSDSFTITDSYSRIVAYKRDLSEAGLVPSITLYPSTMLIPLTPIALSDICSNVPSKNLPDGFTSTDNIGPYTVGKGLQDSVDILDTHVKTFGKNLYEVGLMPHSLLYPSNSLHPEGGITMNDNIGFGFSRWLSDSFIIGDIISSFNIGKYFSEYMNVTDFDVKIINKYFSESCDISDIFGIGFSQVLSDSFTVDDIGGINFNIKKCIDDNINILDIILFSIGSYLEENINAIDEISKGSSKLLNDSFIIEDNIVKNIVQLLSEYTVITDDVETTLRTLVRAVLRAIKLDNSTLRAF